nr:uncharacterized protein LOC100179952 [Ciona intestinalis]|eukprot:XP_002120727.1 uncharacterized protein LOC100179952 [Ciona intestinalis]
MKFLSLVSVSLLIGFTLGAVTPAPPVTCYVGRSSGTIINATNFEEQLCAMGESCRTDIVKRENELMIEKKCHNTKACFSQTDVVNEFQCYSGLSYRNKLHVCLFCCSTDRCNNMIEMPSSP